MRDDPNNGCKVILHRYSVSTQLLKTNPFYWFSKTGSSIVLYRDRVIVIFLCLLFSQPILCGAPKYYIDSLNYLKMKQTRVNKEAILMVKILSIDVQNLLKIHFSGPPK